MPKVQDPSKGLITYTIKVDGKAIPEQFQVHSIVVEQMINRITFATIKVIDGDASKEDFSASESKYFVPGNNVTVEVGYDSKNKPIFNGIITKMSLKVEGDLGSTLEFVCKDLAVKMTVGRKNNNYQKMTDSNIMSKIIGNYAGLSAEVASTSPELAEMVQYYSSDWDFILARAEVNGLLVSCLNGKVRVFDPNKDVKPILKVTYGENLFSFDAELNSVTQLSKTTASAWDPKTQKVINGSDSHAKAGPGNISSSKLSKVVALANYQMQTTAAEGKDELDNWSKAQIKKSELGKIIGEVQFQGTELVSIGQYITLNGVGDRFNGDHFVSKISHKIVDGNWLVDAHIGLEIHWFIQEPDVVAPTAAGLLPGVQGLHSAIVKKIYDDPDSGYRILITLPLLDPQQVGIWARLGNFYSSGGFGSFFLPEVDDEVIVGFLNDDPRYPIILGSMYSHARKPFCELQPNQDNSHKAIVTKSETRLVFNDKDIQITITTPAGNKILLDDKDKQISITDQNSNSIVMSNAGIDMKSPKNITISADQKVSISGKMGVDVNASSGDINNSAMNISDSADMAFTAKGGLSGTVDGGTSLTVKAAMVMIN
jgi:Rhs element Vgr protein